MSGTSPTTFTPDWNMLLANYRQLINRVDGLCRKISTDYSDLIVCHEGCDSCCRHFTLFPVEAVALALAVARLPSEEAEMARTLARSVPSNGPCPLLSGGRCLLYEARPLICRTHGLPLLTARDGNRQVDFCPLNFREMSSLPGSAVIDLNRLNELLVAVNALFCAVSSIPEKRYTLVEAILLDMHRAS